MPTYTFREFETGRAHQITLPIAEYDRLMKTQDGDGAVEIETDAGPVRCWHDWVGDAGTVGTRSPRGWPIKSDALACHPNDIAKESAFLASQGAATDFTPQGQPILTSRKHRNAVMAAYKAHDRDAGFGDRAAP